MSRSLSHCVIKLHEEHHALEDYQGGVPRWCNGCGDNAILAAMQRLCSEEDLAPENTVFVSGIGCSSRLPHYMKTYGFHGLHGRAFPVAEGIKMARPDLNVFVSTGDGDCCSIGAAHWIHALRYNMNLTVVLHDNHVYGLTKKQASPTVAARPEEQHHAVRRDARADEPADRVARRAGRVVHRPGAWTGCPRCCTTSCSAAFRHRGFSFVRVLQRCPEFMPKAFDPWLHDPQRTMLLTHADGLQLSPSLSSAYRNQREHDPIDIDSAREIASLDDPIPVGILYRNPDAPVLRRPAPRRPAALARVHPRRPRTASSTSTRSGRRTKPAQTRALSRDEREAVMDMQAKHPDQLIFHLTGQRQGDGLSRDRRPRPAPGAARAVPRPRRPAPRLPGRAERSAAAPSAVRSLSQPGRRGAAGRGAARHRRRAPAPPCAAARARNPSCRRRRCQRHAGRAVGAPRRHAWARAKARRSNRCCSHAGGALPADGEVLGCAARHAGAADHACLAGGTARQGAPLSAPT